MAKQSKERGGVVLTQRERVDMAQLRRLLAELPKTHRDYQRLELIKETQVKGWFDVNYYYAKGFNFGRLYSDNGVLCLKSTNRARLTKSLWIDIDLANAYGVIFSQVFRKCGIPCPALDEYTARRSEIIAELRASFQDWIGREVSRDDIKKLFLLEFHGGHYLNFTGGFRVKLLDQLHQEIRTACNALSTQEAWRAVYAKTQGKKHRMGTFMSYVGQVAEAQIILAAREFILETEAQKPSGTATRYQVGVIIFDGFHASPAVEPLIPEMQAYVEHKTGYAVKFEVKPMETEDTRWAPQLPETGKPLVLFELDGVLSTRGVLRPGIQQLARDLEPDYELGIYTVQTKLQAGRTVRTLEALLGHQIRFYHEEHCVEPSKAYVAEHGGSEKQKLKTLAKARVGRDVVLVESQLKCVKYKHRSRCLLWSTKSTDFAELARRIREFRFAFVEPPALKEGKFSRWLPGVQIIDYNETLVRDLRDLERRVNLICAGMGARKTTRIIERSRHVIESYEPEQKDEQKDDQKDEDEEMKDPDEDPSELEAQIEQEFIEKQLQDEAEAISQFLDEADAQFPDFEGGLGSDPEEEIEAEPDGPRILVITPRTTLVDALHAKFGPDFGHYKTFKSGVKARLWITCYESLYKLKGECCYDEVYVDEARTVMDNVTNVKTNHGHTSENFTLIRKFLINAKKVIMADADALVDGALACFLQTDALVLPNEIAVHRYAPGAMDRSLLLTQDRSWFEDEIESSLLRGERVAVCCRQRKGAYAFMERYKGLVNSKVYTSDTPDAEIREAMQNLNATLADVHFVCLTSKCAMGVSCELQWDRIFVDMSETTGCSVRDQFQMFGRFRNLQQAEVVMLVSSQFAHDEGRHPNAYEQEVHKLYKQTDRTRSEYYPYLRFHPSYEEVRGRIEVPTPNDFTDLVAHTRAVRSDRQWFEILTYQKRIEFAWRDDDTATDWSQDMKDALSWAEEAKKLRKTEALERATKPDARGESRECSAQGQEAQPRRRDARADAAGLLARLSQALGRQAHSRGARVRRGASLPDPQARAVPEVADARHPCAGHQGCSEGLRRRVWQVPHARAQGARRRSLCATKATTSRSSAKVARSTCTYRPSSSTTRRRRSSVL